MPKRRPSFRTQLSRSSRISDSYNDREQLLADDSLESNGETCKQSVTERYYCPVAICVLWSREDWSWVERAPEVKDNLVRGLSFLLFRGVLGREEATRARLRLTKRVLSAYFMFGVLQWFCLSVTETALIWVRPWSFFSIFIVSVTIWHDSTSGLEIQAREYSISLATFSLIGKKVWTRSLWLLMSPKYQPVPFFLNIFLT